MRAYSSIAAESRQLPPSAVAVRTRRLSRARATALQTLDDKALLDWVIEGDESGTRAFLDRFRGLILRMARLTGERAGVRLGADELADILGQVSMNLIAHDRRRLRLYDANRGSSVSTWIGVIAESTTRDHLRHQRRRPATPVSYDELEQVQSPTPDPEAAVLDRQLRQMATEAIELLSERDRAFVALYFGQAMAPEAVAEALGISVATVYSKKAKITARLGTLMQGRSLG